MHAYLKVVYKYIFMPMEKSIKKILAQFHLANESEVYTTNLLFILCDESSNNRYKNDPSLKQEYNLTNLNYLMATQIQKYQEKFQDLIKKAEATNIDPNASINISVALYLATYFSLSNQSS